MAQFRKKPVVIEAFCLGIDNIPDWFMDHVSTCNITLFGGHPLANDLTGATIKTLEGNMLAQRGDFIIQGVKGEVYPCKPDIFEATYEPVDPPAAVREGP